MARSVAAQLRQSGVVALVTVQDAENIHEVADALIAGGVSAIEVTLRTSAGWDAIERLGARSDVVVGAGTVLDVAGVRRAAGLGASFIVSPGFDDSVVQATLELELLALPGIATPSELQHARSFGLTELKLFPAEPLGGVTMLSALRGPFPDINFMPSGGVSLSNLESYLSQPNVFAAGCSWLVTDELVAARRFDEIRLRAQEAVARRGAST
jgi:2-dehydro-3-deoxyphosphogluconate aldolase/(4S)-4-hydroxy-2-oxoglutarate aldolase